MEPIADDGQKEEGYYTTSEAAKNLGLSKRIIIRLCEQGKFKGARQVGANGHWRIPEENFIIKREQYEATEKKLRQIDKKNEKAGDVDEFDL